MHIVEVQTLGIQRVQTHEDRIFVIVAVVVPPSTCGFISKFTVHFLGGKIACTDLQEGTARAILHDLAQGMRQQPPANPCLRYSGCVARVATWASSTISQTTIIPTTFPSSSATQQREAGLSVSSKRNDRSGQGRLKDF